MPREQLEPLPPFLPRQRAEVDPGQHRHVEDDEPQLRAEARRAGGGRESRAEAAGGQLAVKYGAPPEDRQPVGEATDAAANEGWRSQPRGSPLRFLVSIVPSGR